MKSNLTIFLFSFLLCLTLSVQAQLSGLLWYSVVEMDNQIYPSYVWANANRGYLSGEKNLQNGPDYYGDSEGQIGVHIALNSYKQANIKVVVEAPAIMEASEFSTTLFDQKTNIDIFPEIQYKWDILAKWKQPKPVNLSISVYVNNEKVDTKSQVISVRSINDCPYLFVHRTGFVHDMNFMYAAYVNENHPRINNELLPEMLKQGVINKITGYQESKDEVIAQIFAVWNMLRKRGVAYSSLNSYVPQLNAKKLPFVMSQYVRTMDDALISGQANCVDGTVLMASILFRMGLKPLIVTTPNHCFLGVILDEKTQNIYFVETTMLNMKIDEKTAEVMSKVDICNKDVIYGLLYDDSYYAFAAASLTGQKNFEEIADKVVTNSELYGIPVDEKNVTDVIKALQYQIYEVEKYRREGLLPLSD